MIAERLKVDVIIPVYKPDSRFDELLRRLSKQTYQIHRVIVMNTERSFWENAGYTAALGTTGQNSPLELRVYHVTKQEFDHGRTRHQGMMLSKADVGICMTQDAVPADPGLVEKLVDALYSEENVAVSYARQLPAAGCGVIERHTREFNYPAQSRVKTAADVERLGIKTYFCSNVCAAYKIDLYKQLGGFIKKTIFNEDMIFAANAIKSGYKIAYAADARVIHSHNYSAGEQLHRNFDLAVSQADHPEVFSGIAAEGEGIRLVADTARWLIDKGRWYLLPELIIKSGFKYVGFRLGKNYRRLPKTLILKLTMNRSYWE